jgi:type II secretory ATPase GspE/PulE/Tfp pilus assembly ATPase PilB-like protein
VTVSLDTPTEGWPDLTSDPEAIRLVPKSLALEHDVLPLAWDGDELAVAVPATSGAETLDRIRYETGARVRAFVAPRELIRTRLTVAYPSVSAPLRSERDGESPVVSLLDAIVEDAVERGASDIHFEPGPAGGRARERIHGTMSVARSIPPQTYDRVVARLKLLGGMDIADRRQPQDGHFTVDVAGRSIDARVATLPTPDGEKVVVRLLSAQTLAADLSTLGMREQLLETYRRAIRSPYGLVLVAGPTGSGKTTTLYASLADRNRAELNVCTIEDPVEVRFPEITQVQISPRAGLTFASALRAIVRQDPDIVMIGEIRDAETAHAALEASLAGHLVLSSIHAGDAEGALERLVAFGVSRRAIAAGVRGILAQRLVRRITANGSYGSRTGVFELANVDRNGRVPIGGQGALAYQIREMVETGQTDVREARRILGAAS